MLKSFTSFETFSIIISSKILEVPHFSSSSSRTLMTQILEFLHLSYRLLRLYLFIFNPFSCLCSDLTLFMDLSSESGNFFFCNLHLILSISSEFFKILLCIFQFSLFFLSISFVFLYIFLFNQECLHLSIEIFLQWLHQSLSFKSNGLLSFPWHQLIVFFTVSWDFGLLSGHFKYYVIKFWILWILQGMFIIWF